MRPLGVGWLNRSNNKSENGRNARPHPYRLPRGAGTVVVRLSFRGCRPDKSGRRLLSKTANDSPCPTLLTAQFRGSKRENRFRRILSWGRGLERKPSRIVS